MNQASIATDVQDLLARQAALTKGTTKANADVAKKIKALQMKVLAGTATTGSMIDDYLLVQHAILPPSKMAKPWHELEEQMLGKTGQLVMIVTRWRKQHGFRGCFGGEGPRESDYHIATRHVLAILVDDKLRFDIPKKAAFLPVAAHVEVRTRGQMEKTEGPMQFDAYAHDYSSLPPPSALDESVSAGHSHGKRFEIVVGDAKVLAKPTDFDLRFVGGEWIVARNMAARLLGKKVPDSPEEQRYWAEARKQTLEKLNSLRDTFRHLSAQVSGLERRVRQGDALLDESELPFVAPYGPRKEAWDNLLATLARAKEIGLAEHPLVKLVDLEVKPVLASQAKKAAEKK